MHFLQILINLTLDSVPPVVVPSTHFLIKSFSSLQFLALFDNFKNVYVVPKMKELFVFYSVKSRLVSEAEQKPSLQIFPHSFNFPVSDSRQPSELEGGS